MRALGGFVLVLLACSSESTTVGSMNPRSDASVSDALAGDGGSALDGNVDAACVKPAYPSGPYGVIQGQTMSPVPQWQGYVDGGSQVSTIQPSDYFDPAQCKGAAALFVVEIDATDPTAVDVTTLIAQDLAGPWKNGRVRVLMLLTRGATGQPATLGDVTQWKSAHGVTWTIAADPTETYKDPNEGFYPQIRLVVDTCTMKINRWVHRDPVDTDATVLGARLTCP